MVKVADTEDPQCEGPTRQGIDSEEDVQDSVPVELNHTFYDACGEDYYRNVPNKNQTVNLRSGRGEYI